MQALVTRMATRPAHIEGTILFERDKSPESDLSNESNEDQAEHPSLTVAYSGIIIHPIVFLVLVYQAY